MSSTRLCRAGEPMARKNNAEQLKENIQAAVTAARIIRPSIYWTPPEAEISGAVLSTLKSIARRANPDIDEFKIDVLIMQTTAAIDDQFVMQDNERLKTIQGKLQNAHKAVGLLCRAWMELRKDGLYDVEAAPSEGRLLAWQQAELVRLSAALAYDLPRLPDDLRQTIAALKRARKFRNVGEYLFVHRVARAWSESVGKPTFSENCGTGEAPIHTAFQKYLRAASPGQVSSEIERNVIKALRDD
jgi:hypothetical protein